MTRRRMSTADRRQARHGHASRHRPEPSPIHDIDADTAQEDVENMTVTEASASPPDDVEPPDDLPASEHVDVEVAEPEHFPARAVRAEVGWLDRPAPERRPVIHPALHEPRALALDLWERGCHWCKFHGLRSLGVYEALILGYAGRGIARLGPGAVRWASDRDGHEAIQLAKAAGDHQAIVFHKASHRRSVIARTLLVMGGAGVAVTSPLWLFAAMVQADTRLAGLTMFVATLGFLAWFGRPLDKPFLPRAADAENAPSKVITDVMIRQALVDAGLSRKDDPESIDFAQPPTRVISGTKGWECVVVLPGNKNAVDAIKAEVKIAAGLDIDESRLFLERVRGSAGSARRVRVFVANEDPMSAAPVRTPLADAGPIDFMKPAPFGNDARGEEVRLSAVFSNVLVSAQPGLGKTFTARLFAAAAALDPYVQLMIFDGKGGSDWMAFEKVAHRFGLGERDAVVELLLQTLRDLKDEMAVRYERLQDLRRRSPGTVRESKITSAIAKNPALKMPITVLVIDEVQEYFDHPKYGAELKDLAINISRRGRAIGIVLVLATQRPDGTTIPTKLRANCQTRLCGKVDNRDAVEMVLGSLPDGTPNPMRIQRHQMGTVVVLGASDDNKDAQFDGRLVRAHYMDDDCLDEIIERAHKLRAKANTITGAAAGEQPTEDVPSRLLDDVLDVFRPGEDKTWLSNLAGRLAEAWPQQYSGYTGDQLGKSLRNFRPAGWKGKGRWPYAPDSEGVWGTPDDPDNDEGKSPTRRGVTRAALMRAHRALAAGGELPEDDEEAA